ncbi:MAG TPA: ABC transporter ATP-binding protein [archaeon]|nr:ABC transporter ATP-binding protein [archaeon]
MDALVVQGALKKFSGKNGDTLALGGVDFKIEKGEIFGLLGPNGAGKTTLISAICGLIELDGGKITVLGKDCLTQKEEVSQEIGLVTGFAGLLQGLSVKDLLKYYSLLYSVQNFEKRIEEVLEQTGLAQKKDQVAQNLSSGFKQRFYIAKALLSNPQVLLLDEPTVGLDIKSAMKIRALIKKLSVEGKTILLTTHYMGEAEQLCDRIALINSGKIVALGTISQLKSLAKKPKAGLEEVFLKLTSEEGEDDE